MSMKLLDRDHSVFLRRINWQLFLVLLVMVACFFTWSENINVTRAIKLVGRLGMVGASWSIYRRILNYGAADNLNTKNPLSPALYALYLLLGFVSFMWSTNIGYSALQWFMTAQTIFFCFFFIKSLFLLDQYFPNHSIRLFNLIGNTAFVLVFIFVIGMYLLPNEF